MLSIFKNLFSKKEEPIEEVSLDEAFGMLEKAQKGLVAGSEDTFTEQIEEIRKTALVLKDKLEALKNAELRNPKITERERQFMTGNRESFLKQGMFFTDGISKLKAEDAESFAQDFKYRLAALRKSTSRNLMVLQDYFKNEAGMIVHTINTLDRQVSGLTRLRSNEQLRSVEDSIERMKQLMTRRKLASESEKELSLLKKKISAQEKGIAETKLRILEFRKSDEMQTLRDIRERIRKRESDVSDIETVLRENFATLERALRKYEHMALDSATVNNILDNPIDCAMRNPEKTIEALEQMKKAIDGARLDLKDKKKERTLEASDYIIHNIDDVRQKTRDARDELYKLENLAGSHPAAKSERMLAEQLKTSEVEMERLKMKMEHIEKPITKEQIKTEIAEIEQKVSEHIGKIKIIV